MAEPRETAGHQVTVSRSNPFPGLRAFNPVEHYLYFGRSEQTDDLMGRLRSTHFLSVVGTSGSGKSSLVLAGLVPGLHSGFMTSAGSSWRVAIMRPGGDPIGNLATELASPDVIGEEGDDEEIARSIIEAALRGSSLGLAQSVEVSAIPERDNVLLVVDQFEELFRFKQSTLSGTSREEGVAFVKLLLQAVEQPGRLYIVITMRSDFIGDCMEFPGLPEAINEGQYLVPRMTRDELRQAITGPVGVAGGKISPRLVSRLLNEVGDELDQLPVMQHALMRMWGCWEETGNEGSIDLEQYKAIGTMKNALSLHAEKAYQELQEGREREIAERVFKTLTEMEGEGRGIRRPARVSELCEISESTEEEIARVIGHFRIPGRSFLVPPSSKALSADTIIDISHESLMRNWERLTEWTLEEAESARIYRRLSDAAQHFEAGEGGLWRSPELELGLGWREENQPTAAWARRYDTQFERAIAFLEESQRERDAYQERRRQADRKKRLLKRGIFAGLLAVALILAFSWSVMEEKNFLGAVTKALTVNDPLLKAQVLGEMPEPWLRRVGWLLRRNEPSQGGLELEALRSAAAEMIPLAAHVEEGKEEVPGRPALSSLAVSPDGRLLATGASDGTARVWKTDGRGLSVLLKGHFSEVTSISFRPRPRSKDAEDVFERPCPVEVLTSSLDGTARFWCLPGDPSRSSEVAALHQVRIPGGVASAEFSPDGRRIVAAGRDKTARIWEFDADSEKWSERLRLEGHTGEVTGASFSSDGERILTFSKDKTARIWSLDGEQPTVVLEGHNSAISAAAFSPDSLSKWVVTADSFDGTARLWSADGAGEPLLLRGRRTMPVTQAVFSPDAETVATAGFDKKVRLWHLREGDSPELVVLSGHEGPVRDIVFTPDGEHLISTSSDKTARIWRTSSGDMLQILHGHSADVLHAAVARKFVVTAGRDGVALVWPLDPGEPWRFPHHKKRVSSLAVWSPEEGANHGVLNLISGSDDTTARAWSVASQSAAPRSGAGSQPASISISKFTTLKGHIGRITGVGHQSDSGFVATSSTDGTVLIWRIQGESGEWRLDGERLAELKGHVRDVHSVSFGPGGKILTAGIDATVRLWERVAPEEWEESDSFQPHGDLPLSGASFSPDGSRIVTTSIKDPVVRLWSAGFEPLAELAKHEVGVVAAAFSPDGNQLVTSSVDRTARIWTEKGASWSSIALEGHEGPVTSASFSFGGKTVVTASIDGTARVWRVEDGKELYVLEALAVEPGTKVSAAAFSPDGSHVVTGLSNGSLLLWRVTEKGLHDYLGSASSACLPVEQRRQLLGEFDWQAKRAFVACETRAGRRPEISETAE